jgi:5-oxopent-3-ene-1,2,5-tricarboxylate decarboxylase / 2-hydroxyhepta-2,4-diene-1,7-dioate isomerase
MTNDAPRPVELTDELREQLLSVSTATIASQLQQRGMQNCFFAGLKPLLEGQHMIGYAHTLRYVPSRPDLQKLIGFNAQKVAVEAIQQDEVLVVEARGEPHAGTIGDIYATRAKVLGAAGVITDGALRDTPAIRDIGMPVYHQSSHAATLGRLHTPLDHQIPIACGGVTVMPGDIIVGDEEGAICIPAALVEEVAEASIAMEIREEFALERVGDGASTYGYFPLAKENQAEFEAWKEARGK